MRVGESYVNRGYVHMTPIGTSKLDLPIASSHVVEPMGESVTRRTIDGVGQIHDSLQASIDRAFIDGIPTLTK